MAYVGATSQRTLTPPPPANQQAGRWEGRKGRGEISLITLTPTLSRQGRGNICWEYEDWIELQPSKSLNLGC